MAIKVVLTPLYGGSTDATALAAALSVARRFSAHIDVMHVRADPRTMIPYIGEGMSGALIEEMVSSAEQQADERAARVRKLFDDWRAQEDLPLADKPGKGPSCAWTEAVGRPDATVARRGRLADLIVVCRGGEETATTATETLEAALLESGRPLLVAAASSASSLGARIAIAWNGGAEAARAVAAALPLLASADSVTVIAVGDAAPREADARMLAGYLARHGITVQINSVESGGAPIGETLLAEAERADADLMVMGAYTHSRLRELIFGGVTREILGAADLPVLMAH